MKLKNIKKRYIAALLGIIILLFIAASAVSKNRVVHNPLAC